MSTIFKQAYTLLSPEQKPKEWHEGCLICLVVGFLISMGSTFRLIKLMEGDPQPFAVMYTIGNVLGLCSTCFLYGPWAQVKQMFAPTRLVATGVYLFFMGLTLFLAFYTGNIPLRIMWLVFSIFFQFLALVWYTLSYIPFARQIMLGICQQTCCKGLCPAQQEEGLLWDQL